MTRKLSISLCQGSDSDGDFVKKKTSGDVSFVRYA